MKGNGKMDVREGLKFCGGGLDKADVSFDTCKGSRTRLLIAEDHALVRQGLRAMFSECPDLEIVGEAADGREAVELCRVLEPDLVLMDIRMPRMDGLEATKVIKEAQPAVSVLMVTTHCNPEFLLEAVRSGAAGYVLKESSIQELLAAVRRVLNGEPILDHALAMRLLKRISEEPQQRPAAGDPADTPDGYEPTSLECGLSGREIEVLRLIAAGKTNRQIAQKLCVSLSSVKTYVQRIIKKLGVSDRTQATVRAIELGLLSDQR